jgi:hypothetical protein
MVSTGVTDQMMHSIGLFTPTLFHALFRTLFRPFSPFLPFSSFFARLFPPFSIRSTKRVEHQRKRGTCNSGGNGNKRARKGAQKRVGVRPPLWGSLFPPFLVPFLPPFLHFMQSGCSYCSSKVTYYLKCAKRAEMIFPGFHSSLSYILCQT